MAWDGWECSELSGPATLPCAPISASTRTPARSAASADITTTAAAPSEICEAVPAVIVPSFPKAGRSLAKASTVVPGRMPSSCVTVSVSPLFCPGGTTPPAPPARACGTGTPTISAANRPFLVAAAARWWDMAANSSCCSRVMPSSRPLFSVDSPMDRWSKASVRPSRAIESSTVTGPYL